MLIRHIGHAEFLLELENGLRIVTDPYDASCGYPMVNLNADAVLVSHHHHDHDAVDTIQGAPQIIDFAGERTLTPDVKLTAINAWHDDAQGTKRGGTLLFLLEAEGMRIAHLGDLGCSLNAEQLSVLSPVDILMVPVGGFFTIDAKKAKEIAEQLEAKVILPMHYRTDVNASWPIAPVEEFLKLYDEAPEYPSLLRVTSGDISCQPHLVVL